MRLGICTLRGKGWVVGLALLALLAVGSNGFAKTVKYKSSGAGTYIKASFTYDGVSPASIFTASGRDNLGGASTFQCVSEFVPTKTACTAPDSTAGTTFNLVQSDCAGQYTQGSLQHSGVFDTTVGAAASTQCFSSTTSSFGGTTNYKVTGGEGKLSGASGSLTSTYTGNSLAAPGTPPGTNGFFGAFTFTATGTITRK